MQTGHGNRGGGPAPRGGHRGGHDLPRRARRPQLTQPVTDIGISTTHNASRTQIPIMMSSFLLVPVECASSSQHLPVLLWDR